MKNIFTVLCVCFLGYFNSFSQNAGKCPDFDGSNDYIDCDTSYRYQPAQLTIEAWINADAWRVNNWQGTILSTDTWSGTGGQRGWALRTGDNGRLGLLVANGSTAQWMECMSAQIMSTGKWYHVAGTYDGSVQRIYINGVLVQSLSNTGGIRYNGLDKMIIGDCIGQLGNRVFDGKIDEVRLWKVALDTTTMRQWMHKQLSSQHPQSSKLVSYYKLNEGSGTNAYDSSSNKFKGTLINFSSTPWVASYAPLASFPNTFLNDVASVWSNKTLATSSVLSVVASLSGNNYVVFGHNNKNLSYSTSNKPSFILKRINRVWRIEKEGTASGNVIFDYNSIDTSGFNTFKLLVSSDTNFTNASIINGNKIGNKRINFNVSFQDSVFITIGAYDFQGPTVETSSIAELKAFSVKVNAKVLDDGGLTTTRGVCWSTSSNPKVHMPTKLSSGTGAGSYQIAITGLNQNTSYHVRAYAYNSKDTAYGADSVFKTPVANLPTVKLIDISSITGFDANIQGNVTSDGNVPVSSRGFCWSTSINPDISLSTKTSNGSGTGVFAGSVSNLQPNTTYHIRAYATNSVGTSYSNDTTFKTAAPPTVSINSISKISYYNAVCSAEVVSDGGMPVKQRGICYSTSSNPDLINSTTIQSGSGIGKLSVSFSSLLPNTVYHIRAYAINDVDTAYSADSSFKTVKTSPPVVTTASILNITEKSAIGGGNVVSDGGAMVTQRGVCWSTSVNPKASLTTKSVEGKETGIFTSNISGLTRGTTYHVRAYAINNVDTAYGGDSVFTTPDAPKVTTDNVTMVNHNTASGGGTVTSDGGFYVVKRGVCYGTSPNPDIKNNDVSTDGFGLGHFNSTLYFLQAGKTYYVRAYAINAIDTSYGNEVSFKTPSLPVVTTTSVTDIKGSTAQSGGNITSGDNITERGVVWSKYPNPTIALSTKTKNGSGSGNFTSSITGLMPNTEYHVRAYATNIVGTAYGADLIFTTADKPVVTTASATINSYNSINCGGNVTSDGGTPVFARGVAWSTVSDPPNKLQNKTSDGTGTGNFTSLITGLTPDTTYYIYAYAINAVDTAYGVQKTFKITPPFVSTGTNSEIATNSATVAGLANARGIATTISFEYGLTSAYGNTVFPVPSTTNGTTDEVFSAKINGLKHNTTYHYRIKAENTHGISYGADSVFTTDFDNSITDEKYPGVYINTFENEFSIVITNKNNSVLNISLYNIMGKEILSENHFEPLIVINKHLKPGVFLIVISNSDVRISKKIIIK